MAQQTNPQVQMDQDAVNLAKAIRQTESGGNFGARGKSGENGAYQWMPDTWKEHAKTALGDENAPMSAENQNAVAYTMIKKWKDSGYNVAQIAAKWNSGDFENWEKKVGVNKAGVKYNVPQYVKSVADAYQKIKAGGRVGMDPSNPSAVSEMALTPTQEADRANKKETGAIFGAKTGKETAASAALKTLGNIPSSAFNFAKGAVNMLNPMNIVQNVSETVRLLKEESARTGENPVSIFAKSFKETPQSAYEVLVPEAGKGVAEAAYYGIKGDSNKAVEGLEKAQRNVINDPVGSVLPFIMLAEGGAKVLDKAKVTKGATAAVDAAISKTAQTVTKPVGYVFNKAGQMVKDTTKFATSQATGLQPTTISEVMKNPDAFVRETRGSIDRASLGTEVKAALKERTASLKETGETYAPVRNRTTPVTVEPTFLTDIIRETTGLELTKGGKLKSSAASKIREAKDVRALQNFYDRYQLKFKKGAMTTNEFLNMRTDLAKLSKFERELGKSQPVEAVTKVIRKKANTAYRSQVKGLKAIDNAYAKQSLELKELGKGFLDRNGNLTDAAMNRIANATGKGKDLLLGRLEQISPGITRKIKILKAIEDIEHASGIKVGTYNRGIIMGGLTLTAGLIPALIEAILTSPEVAVPLLRKYSLLKNSRVVGSIMKILQKSANVVNELPQNAVGQITSATENAAKR